MVGPGRPPDDREVAALEPLPDVFDDTHYASTLPRKLRRALELGPAYYLWHLPRYLRHRRARGLPWWDLPALVNPLREVKPRIYHAFPPPPQFARALRIMEEARIRLAMPRHRLEALVGAWWAVSRVIGDVIECGAYRGATSLLIALLGYLHGIRQTVLMLDTFAGIPETSLYDMSRRRGEFQASANQEELIRRQARQLGVEGRVEIQPGLFSDTFRFLETRPLRFALVHIDANIYRGTLEACEFTIPRTAPGGIVVFDDYNGVCDLGARLAIDQYFYSSGVSPLPLAGYSAYLRVEG
jgi:Macrocin-O-methyltransferase (TylF)